MSRFHACLFAGAAIVLSQANSASAQGVRKVRGKAGQSAARANSAAALVHLANRAAGKSAGGAPMPPHLVDRFESRTVLEPDQIHRKSLTQYLPAPTVIETAGGDSSAPAMVRLPPMID